MSTGTNPLVAERVDSTTGWTGIGLAEDIELLVSAFNSGSWIDGTIGGFAAGLDVLATVTDPLGQLVSWGVAWLIEHLKPLSDALDWLAGDPDQITAYAGTWTNVATAMRTAAGDLDTAVRTQLPDWQHIAADAYRRQAGQQHEALATMATGAEAMSTITLGTGLVVALARELVRDLIADFVSVLAVRLWEWLAITGATLGAGAGWVAAQVSTLAAKWAAKIARIVRGLISSLRRLAPMLGRLDEILQQLRTMLARLSGADSTGVPSGGGGRSTSPVPSGGGHTQPSSPPDPDRKPRGLRTTPARPNKKIDRPRVRENQSADILAQHGYDVLQNPPTRGNGKNPDYLIEGEYFDCYAPQSAGSDGIREKISEKSSKNQAKRIILYLDDVDVSPDELRALLLRKPIGHLEEIKIIQDGQVINFYPFD